MSSSLVSTKVKLVGLGQVRQQKFVLHPSQAKLGRRVRGHRGGLKPGDAQPTVQTFDWSVEVDASRKRWAGDGNGRRGGGM